MIFSDIMLSLRNMHPCPQQLILVHILHILGQSIHLLQHQVGMFLMHLVLVITGAGCLFQVKYLTPMPSLQWMPIITTTGTTLLILLQATELVVQINHLFHLSLRGQLGMLIFQDLECILSSLVTG